MAAATRTAAAAAATGTVAATAALSAAAVATSTVAWRGAAAVNGARARFNYTAALAGIIGATAIS